MTRLDLQLIYFQYTRYAGPLPIPQHVHVAWAPCLVCEVEAMTFETLVSRFRIDTDRFAQAIGEALMPVAQTMVDAVAEMVKIFAGVFA